MKPSAFLRSLLLASSTLLTISHSHALTYYWDNNGTGANYGTAGGTWSATTVGSATQGWTTATNGTTAPTGSITTLNTNGTTDAVNFGNAASGLSAGTINVSGTVASGNMTFASGSGAIVLSGGQINFAAASTITINNASDTINSVIGGAATSLTKTGSGILNLSGASTYTGSTIVSAGTLNLGGGGTTGSLDSTVLTLAGGAFHYTRSDSQTETFTTTNINSGSSSISVSAGNILNLGTVTRGSGVTFDFSSTGSGTLAAATASNTGGIMSGFTFGDSWAVANGPGVAISALGSYTLTSVAGTTGANYTGNNIDVDNSAGTLSAAITTNSLRFRAAAANTLALATGTNTISSSGIIVASAVGANLSTISGGTITGAASKDLSIIQNNASGGLTISSAIANNTSTSITKSGAGLLTLAGNNTFSGGLTIHAGGVMLGNVGALNSLAGSENAVTLTSSSARLVLNANSVVVRSLNSSVPSAIVENANAAAATLTIGNSGNASSTFDGLLQNGTGGGALGIIKAGSGTLTLTNGSNSFSGGISISGGTLNGTNLTLGGSANTITFISSGGALQPVYASSPTYAQNIVINPGATGHLNATNQFYNHTVSGVVSGSGTLLIGGTDNSNGNVTLSNTGNSHTGIIRIGNTTISGNLITANIADGAGAVQLGGSTGSGNLTFSGTGAAQSFTTRVFTLSGTTGGGRITNNGATANIVTISQNLAITANGAKTLTLGGSNTGANSFSGNIGDSGSGATSITKADGGTWILAGNNGYTGTTSVTTGNLNIQHANALGTTAGNTSVTAGATLQLQTGISYAAEPLSYAASGATNNPFLQSVSGNNTWNGPITVTGSANFARISSDADLLTVAGTVSVTSGVGLSLQGASAISVTGQITGAGNVISGTTGTGAGSIRTLSNASNNYTGATSVTGGTLVGIGANAFGSTTGISIGNTTSAILSLRGDSSTDFKRASDSVAYSLTTTTATGVEINVDRATVAGTTAKTMSIGTLGLNNAITNATTFTGANNTSLSIRAVTTAAAVSGTETLTNNISGGGGLTLASVSVLRTGTPTLVIAGTGNTTVTGNITQVATTALTKSGGGKLTLNGINGYTGATAVNGGTLEVALGGSTHASSAVTVSNSGSALVVNGTVNGTLTANSTTTVSGKGTVMGAATISGNLTPGNSAGLLNFNSSLAMANTTATTMEVAGTTLGIGYDAIDAAGALTYDGVLTLALGATFGAGSYTFNLFDFASQSGSFDSIILTGNYTGTLTNSSGIWTTTTNTGNETWTFTQSTGDLGLVVVPEPHVALLGGLGMLMLLRRRR